MNRTTKINILAYASEPDKNFKYEGDIVDYKGKRYFVSAYSVSITSTTNGLKIERRNFK